MAGLRSWDTGHELGSLGYWDLWCIDFMYDSAFEMRMLEMTDSCLFKAQAPYHCPMLRLRTDPAPLCCFPLCCCRSIVLLPCCVLHTTGISACCTNAANDTPMPWR